MTDAELRCPACGAPIVAADTFCEACGAQVGAAAEPDGPGFDDDTTSPARTSVTSGACELCGGKILDDGFCGTCGQKARSPRDHWTEQPAPWVGGVCDKGIVHTANEDAMALAAQPDGSFAVLVVCDGVTSAPHSDRAALAAARAACAELAGVPMPTTTGVAPAISYWSAALQSATAEANSAAVGTAHTLGDPAEPPSCTFVAAVIAEGMISVAWCGDSRAYWLPDSGEPRQLTIDHSLGTSLLAAGEPREQAEADPAFHTITRWLGADSVEHTPEVASHPIDTPGWLLVCSDGLWNYASVLDEMVALVADIAPSANGDPVQLAGALVDWANAAGGHDNITAALARCNPPVLLHGEATPGG
ncbi:MAG TPA: PP2C family serine/threonine-protein phosphatase [Ilumatobacteraceae bacterium]|nr:PP2C family serine/threonine-protein phosphatase [Ilumatobacteraceae bacterium]